MNKSVSSRRQFLTTLLAGAGALGVRDLEAATRPTISAPSAILLDARTGQILFEKNADQPRPVASTQKLLTALTWNFPKRRLCLHKSTNWRETEIKNLRRYY